MIETYLHIGWDSVGHQSRVYVGVDDSHSRNVASCTFFDEIGVFRRVQQDDNIGKTGSSCDWSGTKARTNQTTSIKTGLRETDQMSRVRTMSNCLSEHLGSKARLLLHNHCRPID